MIETATSFLFSRWSAEAFMAKDANGLIECRVRTDAGRLVRTELDTAAFDARERLTRWRELASAGLTIEADPMEFSARLNAVALDRMVLTRLDTSALAVSRSPAEIRRDGFERFVLHWTAVGFDLETNGFTTRFGSGSVVITDAAQSFARGAAIERGSVLVALGRELVEEALPEPERLHGIQLPPAATALLADHMRAMDRWASNDGVSGPGDLGHATAHLLAACVASTPDALERAKPTLEASMLRRARRHIERNLSSRALTPDAVAGSLGMSRSKLFGLFESLGGVASYIQRRRLMAARRALAAPGAAVSITDVAYRCGFSNGSHFSRAFRSHFGVTPSEFRSDPTSAAWACTAESRGDVRDFSRWMLELG